MNLDVRKFLKTYRQDHLVEEFCKLSENKQRRFKEQLLQFDVDDLKRQHMDFLPCSGNYEPLDRCSCYDEGEKGADLLREGKVAVLLLAGGQGSRLGLERPKGSFMLPSLKKSLFQLFCEKLLDAQNRYKRRLYVAIMLSPLNFQQTLRFFQKHDFWGLDKEQIFFFSQKMLPFLDDEGRWILTREGEILAGPDGNGDVFKNLYASPIFCRFKSLKIDYLNVLAVDNPMIDPFDEKLVSFHQRHKADVTVKCIEREEEKMGVLVKDRGKIRVIEYIDIADEDFKKFIYGNIGNFCFSLQFIHKIGRGKIVLPLRRVKKKINKRFYAWKYEKFIFDLLKYADNVEAVCCQRSSYAPLKDKESVRRLEWALLNEGRK